MRTCKTYTTQWNMLRAVGIRVYDHVLTILSIATVFSLPLQTETCSISYDFIGNRPPWVYQVSSTYVYGHEAYGILFSNEFDTR